MYVGGFIVVIALGKFQKKPLVQSPFVRIMVAAGIIVCLVLGIGAAMILGGIIGGAVEFALMKMA